MVSFFIEPFSLLFTPGFCMLSDWAAGPVFWANEATHEKHRAVIAIMIFFIGNSCWICTGQQFSGDVVPKLYEPDVYIFLTNKRMNSG